MKGRELSIFEIDVIRLMTYLYENDIIDPNIIEIVGSLDREYSTLRQQKELIEEKINIDAKTELLIYRDDYLPLIIKSASRIVERVSDKYYSVVYIRFDIDDFSLINNKYSHEIGDRVLIDFARLLKDQSRPTDYIIRFGGEEFDVILPATDMAGAEIYLDKIYRTMEKMHYIINNRELKVTVSAGAAIFTVPCDRLKELCVDHFDSDYRHIQSHADMALYHAKFSGKKQYRWFNKNMDYEEIRDGYSRKKLMTA